MEVPVIRQVAVSDKAQEIIDYALAQRPDQHSTLGLHHWLLALIECRPALCKTLAPSFGDPVAELQPVYTQLCRNNVGTPLSVETLTAAAETRAQAQGREVISACDLAYEILHAAGYPLDENASDDDSDGDPDAIYVSFSDSGSSDNGTCTERTAPHQSEGRTPMLDKLGIDLTRAALAGTLTPIVGREEEIELVIETLCRRTKRNPALVGPAGVGKTAIVEELAQRVVRGEVPEALCNLRLIMLPVSALVANCKYVGEFEERMLALLSEAREPGVVLFIDEAHTILGAGAGSRGSNDLANIIKPALARGEIACIAATTDEEYRLYLESDSALERRFQPIRVQELSAAQTLEVLRHLRETLAQLRGVDVPVDQLEWIVDFAGQYLHNRHFPDKAVDILEQCVAYGLTQGKQTLGQDDVEIVARRMAGMPLEVEHRLHALREALGKRSLLPQQTVDALINRLGVTMRGFELRIMRPNAVILLIGDAETQSAPLAEMIAGFLFGAVERMVSLDFSRFLAPSDNSMLIGSPPGYVGYEGRLTLHQVMQMPWCVLRCDNVESCHPSARDILTHGLNEGMITMADGKRVYLSDTVVVMTADIAARTPMGFGQENGSAIDIRACTAHLLGSELVEQVDVLCTDLRADAHAQQQWLQESLLAELHQRFRSHGMHLSFDASLFPWLLSRGSTHFTRTDWERLIEEQLCPVIIPHLPGCRPQHELLLRVLAEGDNCRVEPAVN